MSEQEKEVAEVAASKNNPSRGIEFDETRYSPHKYLVADDDRKYSVGDVVFVGTSTAVYGPYRLTHQIVTGNGKTRFLAVKDGQSVRSKPMTKAEMEQALANLMAENAKLKSAAAPSKK